MTISKIIIDGGKVIDKLDGEIKKYKVNGEMSEVDWYQQECNSGIIRQFNGKYVIEIEWI